MPPPLNERFVWSCVADGVPSVTPLSSHYHAGRGSNLRQPSDSVFVLELQIRRQDQNQSTELRTHQDKQHKLTKLYRGCDLYWLLLVAEWERNTSFLELPRPPIELPANDFERSLLPLAKDADPDSIRSDCQHGLNASDADEINVRSRFVRLPYDIDTRSNATAVQISELKRLNACGC